MNFNFVIGFIVLSALGATSRFWLERHSVKRFGERWPWGTLVANWLGSLILGGFAATAIDADLYGLAAAYCGAFTTFGGFVGQSFERVRHRSSRWGGVLYLLASAIGSLIAAWVGFQIVDGR